MTNSIFSTIRKSALLGALVLAAACGSDAPSPTGLIPAVPSLSKNTKSGSGTAAETASPLPTGTVNVLARKTAIAQGITASAVIGSAGGVITIKETGFTLWIPMGALSKNTKISVTAMPGSGVAYHFEPHGLKFNSVVWFSQETAFTQSISGLKLGGGYFADDTKLNNHTRQAQVEETYQINLDPLGVIIFGIRHFSGYLVSCA
jgi:hypothetical protein